MATGNSQDHLVLLVQQAASPVHPVRQAAEALLCQQEFTPGYLPFVLVAEFYRELSFTSQ